jgi:ribonuclease HII
MHSDEMICGVDEAGRGPVLGPMVVCGLAVESDSALIQMGVKDSKKLRPARREELAAEIRKVASIEVVEVSADEIDSHRKSMSLNELEARLFASVIDRLGPEVAYVDAADVDEDNLADMITARLTRKPQLHSKHKADATFPVVSAASIIAKVTRDQRVREIEQQIGVPIGSGYCTDPVTVKFLNSWVSENRCLPPHTRKSWAPAQSIMNMNMLRKLDTFEG